MYRGFIRDSHWLGECIETCVMRRTYDSNSFCHRNQFRPGVPIPKMRRLATNIKTHNLCNDRLQRFLMCPKRNTTVCAILV
jgi:hypothetical protein